MTTATRNSTDKIGEEFPGVVGENPDDDGGGEVLLLSVLEQQQEQQQETQIALQELVSNDFGRTLLSPLSCDGLFDFQNCDLHLRESTSSTDSDVVREQHRSISAFGSLGSVTTLTQSLDDSDHENDSQLTLNNEDSDEDEDKGMPQLLAQLVPEPAEDLEFCARILLPEQIQQIHQQLPEALQMNRWERAFCIGRDGDSFLSFLNNCAAYTYTVIVVRTTASHVLGGFASQAWRDRQTHNQNTYFGTGQSFLFATHPADQHVTTTPVTANAKRKSFTTSNPHHKPLSFFRWSGSNDYCQICNLEKGVMAMGGELDFGFRLEDCFERGRTGHCKTYSNPPLVPDDDGHHLGGHFEIADFEVWGLQPLFGFSGMMTTTTTTTTTATTTIPAPPLRAASCSASLLRSGRSPVVSSFTQQHRNTTC